MTTNRLTAATISLAALLAIAGFTALGAIFDYPQILKEPTADILALFHERSSSVVAWFLVLTVGAALLAPAGVLFGRQRGRAIAVVGIAAAAVQVVGLSRWVLVVPWITSHRTFEQLHLWLGEIIGETIGYALTATFTVLVTRSVVRRIAPAWLTVLGYVSAALIASGVVIPLGVGAASLTNFAGYVAWCLWLLALAVVLWRTSPAAAVPAPTNPRPAAVR